MADFTVGKYLAARLQQIGLKHYFMVPGDYNLVLLDELLTNENLQQIGCCNELNAAYAAEGYARANGAGAVFTTYNVGAYSALNGVAGAYAERLPVIFVSSGPNTNDPVANHIMHHTMGTHDFSDQYEVCRQVTCEAVRILHADNAPTLIDQAISTALRERKPVYIEIACNLSAAPCPEPAPIDTSLASTMLSFQPTNPRALTAAVDRASQLLENAKKPILLAGAHLRSYGAIDAFRELAEALGCAVAVMPNAKGFFPEDHPQYAGIYWGEVSTPGCQAIVDWADLVVGREAGVLGLHHGRLERATCAAADDQRRAASRAVRRRRIHRCRAGRLPVRPGEEGPGQRCHPSAIPSPQGSSAQHQAPAAEVDADTQLSRAELWRQIEADLDAKTTLMVETGISWWDGIYTRLPGGARFEIEMQWGSIGWAVPAAFGYSVGLEADRRLVAAIGDGSFQLTAQEVSNMIRHRQEILIFLVNNRGYVIESAIHDGPYNYYKNWDYAGLIDVFNAEDGHGLGLTATTPAELADAIAKARAHKGGPVLIECQIPNEDASPEVISWGSKVARVNARPPQNI